MSVEENWFIRSQREKEYRHHVDRLDRIYSQENLRKKIEETCSNLSKIFAHKKQTHEKDRLDQISKIGEMNRLIEEQTKSKLEFYKEQVLRPQLGLAHKDSTRKAETLHPAANQRRVENTRIQEENKKLVTRLQFIRSELSKDVIEKDLEKLNPYKELRAGRDKHQNLLINTEPNSDSMKTIGYDSHGIQTSNIHPLKAKLEEAKRRRLKGFTFKTPNNLSHLGLRLDKDTMLRMLESLAAGKPKLSPIVQFSSRTSRTQKSKLSESLPFPKQGSNTLSTEVDCSVASLMMPTEDTTREVLKDDPLMLRAPLHNNTEVLQSLKDTKETKEIEQEFAQLSTTLFLPSVAHKKCLEFIFEARSKIADSLASPRKVVAHGTSGLVSFSPHRPSLLGGDHNTATDFKRKSSQEDHPIFRSSQLTAVPVGLGSEGGFGGSLRVRIEGKSKDTDIVPFGQIVVPWTDLLTGPILELVFTDTSRNKVERVQYNITKRHCRVMLRDITGYTLNVKVQLRSAV